MSLPECPESKTAPVMTRSRELDKHSPDEKPLKDKHQHLEKPGPLPEQTESTASLQNDAKHYDRRIDVCYETAYARKKVTTVF